VDEDDITKFRYLISTCAGEIYLIEKDPLLKYDEGLYENLKAQVEKMRSTLQMLLISQTSSLQIDQVGSQSDIEETFLRQREAFVGNPNASPIALIMKSLPNDIDVTFGGKVFEEDLWMTRSFHIEPSTLSPLLAANFTYMITYCQFGDAATLLSKELKEKGRNPNPIQNVENLFLTFSIFRRASGTWKQDLDCIREFNFIYFANQQVQLLKKISLKELQECKQDSEEEFIGTIEKAIGILLKVSHDDIDPVTGTRFQLTDITLDENKKHYYGLIIKQQYLLLVAELLVQLRRFKKNEFLFDETEDLVKKYSTQDQYQKYYDLYGTDGLFDIILDKIDALEKNINNLVLLPSPTHYNQKDILAADKTYLNLLEELEQDKEKIVQASKTEMHRRKNNYKKNIKKSAKSKPSFFEEQKSEANTQPQSKEANLYYEAGRLRHTGLSIDSAIQLYEQAVCCYVKPEEGKEYSYDFFYVGASLAELADCYVRKALAETPDDFCQVNKSNMISIIKWYNQAVVYAKAADECFIKHVSILPETSLKDFEDLAAHIHTILAMTTDKLNFMTKEYMQLVKNLEKEQEVRATERMAAIERVGGIENWRHNPHPKNRYHEIRKQKQTELNQVKSAAQMIGAFVETKVAPVKANFAYLTGKGPLPLLKKNGDAPTEQTIPNDKTQDVLQGGGIFSERLLFLANTNRLLKAGHSESQVLKLLTTDSDIQPPALEEEKKVAASNNKNCIIS